MKIYTKLDLSQAELRSVIQENHQASYKLLLSTFTTGFLWPLVAVWVSWPETDHRYALAWLAAVAAVILGRLYILRQWYKPQQQDQLLSRWENIALVLTFLLAGLWGVAMYSIDINSLGDNFYFLIMIVFAIIAASIGLASYWVSYFWVFTVPMAVFFASSVFFSVQSNQYPLLAATLVFIFYLRQIIYTYHRNIVENILLRKRIERMAEDLGKEKHQAEALAESRKNFLASASHDLRQPLQAMNLFLTALKPFIKQAQSLIIFNKLEASTSGMNELLNRILDISKLDSKTVAITTTTFNIDTLVKALQQEFQGQALNHQLEFQVNSISALVTNDALLLQRVLSNLLANAINYTASGSVRLDCKAIDNHIVIDIIDTGVGIPLDQQTFIFDEFYQVGNVERDRKKGLGLGLSIVKRLCPLLDVEFDFESSPGQGSRFTITLKQELDKAEDIVVDASHNSWDGQSSCVVIVDDDESVLDGLAILFRQWQFEVITATSAQQACALLRQHDSQPVLIISDYRLPNSRTGIEAIEEIRQSLSDPNIPAVIISGDTAPERLSEVAQSGHLLLHKPVKPSFLRAAVQRLLSQD